MSGGLPERPVEDNGRLHLHISFAAVDLAPIIDEDIFKHHAVREEEREPPAFGQERKELHLLAELDMIALLCLFEHLEVFVHLFFFRERRSVDAGEHLALFVAAPICPRDGDETKRLDLARRRKVRSAAEVDERALAVEGDLLPLGKVLYELDLVGLMILAHERDRLFARKRKPLDGKVALDDLFHLRFDLGKIFHRDGRLEINVVIIAVVDDGTDGEFAGRIDGFKRLRKHVRAGMAVNFQPLFIFQRDDLEGVALRKYMRNIDEFSVDFCRDRSAAQPFGNGARRVHSRCPALHIEFIAVFEYDFHAFPPLLKYYVTHNTLHLQ